MSMKSNSAELNDQIATLRADLSALTQTIADMGKQKTDSVIESAKSKAVDVRQSAADQAAAARQQADQLHGQANDFIRTQPGAAMGIAAGLGFLVGMMSTRK